MKPAARFSVAILAAALALCAAAAEMWKPLKRDNLAQLSVDTGSIQKEGDVRHFRYMVDFRLTQGDPKVVYRSIVAVAKLNCTARTLSLVHTDAYAQFGGKGNIVAKTRDTPQETAFKPLTKGTSDEDLYAFVCEGKNPPPLTPASRAGVPIPQAVPAAPAAPAASMKK